MLKFFCDTLPTDTDTTVVMLMDEGKGVVSIYIVLSVVSHYSCQSDHIIMDYGGYFIRQLASRSLFIHSPIITFEFSIFTYKIYETNPNSMSKKRNGAPTFCPLITLRNRRPIGSSMASWRRLPY